MCCFAYVWGAQRFIGAMDQYEQRVSDREMTIYPPATTARVARVVLELAWEEKRTASRLTNTSNRQRKVNVEFTCSSHAIYMQTTYLPPVIAHLH